MDPPVHHHVFYMSLACLTIIMSTLDIWTSYLLFNWFFNKHIILLLSLRDQGEGLTQSHKSTTEDGATFMQMQCSCVYDGASLLNNITSVVLRMNKNKQLYIYICRSHNHCLKCWHYCVWFSDLSKDLIIATLIKAVRHTTIL